MIKRRADILLVGQTPPPHHGQSVVTAMLFEHDWADMDVDRLRMCYSDSIDDVGRASMGKVWHLCSLILKTWKIALTKRPRILYYLPASANKTPVIRDIFYLAAVRWLFAKTVFHYHAGGLPEYLGTIGILGRVARMLYTRADVSIDVIKTSPPTGSFFKSKSNAIAKNGVDVEIVPRRRNDDVFQILFVGVLNEGKGVIQIVETAKCLKSDNCNFVCKLVGGWVSDDFKNQVDQKIEEYQLTENFQFTGPLSGSDKWQAYADADCFFFPSHYEAETFGLVLVEAMAFGLPLVTTHWRGIPQVVEGGECAYLCDVHSPEQYADAIEDVLKNSDRRQQMIESARKHYEKNYTREKFVGAMEEVFREVLES